MENASKALIMAGGVLIALLVIGMLVMFFNNLSDWQSMEQSTVETEIAAEFNKQYDVYARDVYGSELFSIASLVYDYNKRESETKGYTKVELYVEFTKDFDDTDNEYNKYFEEKTYTSSEIENQMKNLTQDRDDVKKEEINFVNEKGKKTTKTIAKLATMRTKDIEELGTPNKDYKDLVNEYNYYKTFISQIKQTVFKYEIFEYDENTGRIEKMKFYY